MEEPRDQHPPTRTHRVGTVCVTGGSSGLGAAVVAAVAEAGGTPPSSTGSPPDDAESRTIVDLVRLGRGGAAVASGSSTRSALRTPSSRRPAPTRADRSPTSPPRTGSGSCASTSSAPSRRCGPPAPTSRRGTGGRDRRLHARRSRRSADATAYCAVQVRGRRVHPGARRRAGGPGRGHPARARGHAHRVLRRPHRAVPARAGRPAQRPGGRRRDGPRGPDRSPPAARSASSSWRRRRSRPGRDRRPRPRLGARARGPAHRRCRRCAALRRAWPTRVVLAAPAAVGPLAPLTGVGRRRPRGADPERRRRPRSRCRRRASRSTCTAAGRRATAAAGLEPGRLVAFACPEARPRRTAVAPDEHEVDRWFRLLECGGGPARRGTTCASRPRRAGPRPRRRAPRGRRAVEALAGRALGRGGRGSSPAGAPWW